MKMAAPGKREYEVDAELMHEFMRNGARAPAYGSIVAAGANACVLHYRDNDAELRKGELLLIDAGCELRQLRRRHHAHLPDRGALLRRATRHLRAGARLAGGRHQGGQAGRGLHRLPRRRHARAGAGLHRPEAVQGQRSMRCSRTAPTSSSTCTAPATGWGSTCTTPATTCRRASGGSSSPAWCSRSSRASTSAPRANVPKAFWNIGVRIEDDVLVTAKGREVLTADCPKKVKDVEDAVLDR